MDTAKESKKENTWKWVPGSLDLVATKSVQATCKAWWWTPELQDWTWERHVFLKQGDFRRCVVSATLALFLVIESEIPRPARFPAAGRFVVYMMDCPPACWSSSQPSVQAS